MDANDSLARGLGVTPPWKLVSQRLDTSTQPHQRHLAVAAVGWLAAVRARGATPPIANAPLRPSVAAGKFHSGILQLSRDQAVSLVRGHCVGHQQ